MALSSRQRIVLAEMGIPVWERRIQDVVTEAQVEPKLIDAPATLAQEQVALQGCFVVVVANLPLSDPEHRLLAAMLRTISLSLEQIDVLDEMSFQHTASESLRHKPVWFIGSACNGDGAHFSLHSDSLNDLLSEPKRKANAWQALKQLARYVK